jgi:hypothetical protein
MVSTRLGADYVAPSKNHHQHSLAGEVKGFLEEAGLTLHHAEKLLHKVGKMDWPPQPLIVLLPLLPQSQSRRKT